jgi:hypothetical protein
MGKTRSVAVMVLIETDDPNLMPENVDVHTPARAARLRKAVMDNLPKVSRVVMVLEEDTARLMCAAHDLAAEAAGLSVRRPPRSYIPPTRD